MANRFLALSCLGKGKKENGERDGPHLVLSPPPFYPSMPKYPHESSSHGSAGTSATPSAASLEIRKALFKVQGMECSACAASIEKAVKRLPGIQDATISILHNKAQVVYHPDFVNVHIMMLIDKDKLSRFLKTGHATFFVYEMQHGYEWRRNMEDIKAFEKTLNKMNQEVRKNKNTKKEVLAMLRQIQERKKVVWIEGEKGWTTWVDAIDGILL